MGRSVFIAECVGHELQYKDSHTFLLTQLN